MYHLSVLQQKNQWSRTLRWLRSHSDRLPRQFALSLRRRPKNLPWERAEHSRQPPGKLPFSGPVLDFPSPLWQRRDSLFQLSFADLSLVVATLSLFPRAIALPDATLQLRPLWP